MFLKVVLYLKEGELLQKEVTLTLGAFRGQWR